MKIKGTFNRIETIDKDCYWQVYHYYLLEEIIELTIQQINFLYLFHASIEKKCIRLCNKVFRKKHTWIDNYIMKFILSPLEVYLRKFEKRR